MNFALRMFFLLQAAMEDEVPELVYKTNRLWKRAYLFPLFIVRFPLLNLNNQNASLLQSMQRIHVPLGIVFAWKTDLSNEKVTGISWFQTLLPLVSLVPTLFRILCHLFLHTRTHIQ
jgi:hypothetical protein